ncbi:hypothetical protein SAMD00079811_79300 (plasmid) [Scytonema sp. HK-05]|uniref:DUF7219 family protein n=1 Tax=Scytonema sp. HK-05 TaxID=1137095 RepID=UPI000B0045F4|nr:hypothetical protein SAMD00079811_79300 [Scytonema sp. HK-05]
MESNIQNFIYPLQRYHGEVKPDALVFNANLQEFATKISYICNLQTNGKLSLEKSYQQMNTMNETVTMQSFSTRNWQRCR